MNKNELTKKLIEMLIPNAMTHREKYVKEEILESEFVKKNFSWEYIDNDSGNQRIVDNQQDTPTRALTENIVNSQEAITMLNEVGINSKNEKVWVYNIENNKFKGKKDKTRTIVVKDFGIGMNSDDFDVILKGKVSKKGDLSNIVTGLYGMGSRGSWPFCGKEKYVIIISRKNPLLEHDSKWVLTVIRLNYKKDENGSRCPYQYLVHKDKSYITYERDIISLEPIFISSKKDITFKTAIKGTYWIFLEFFKDGLLSSNTIRYDLLKYFINSKYEIVYSYPTGKKTEVSTNSNITGFDDWWKNTCKYPNKQYNNGKPIEFKVSLKNKDVDIYGNVYLFDQITPIQKGKDKGKLQVNKNHTQILDGYILDILLGGVSQALLKFTDANLKYFKLRNIIKYMFITLDLTNFIKEHKRLNGEIFMANRTCLKRSPIVEEILIKMRNVLEENSLLKYIDEEYGKEYEQYMYEQKNDLFKGELVKKIAKKFKEELREICNGTKFGISENKSREKKTIEKKEKIKSVIFKEGISFLDGNKKKNKKILPNSKKMTWTRFKCHSSIKNIYFIASKKIDPAIISIDDVCNMQLYPTGDNDFGDSINIYIFKGEDVLIHERDKKIENNTKKENITKIKKKFLNQLKNSYDKSIKPNKQGNIILPIPNTNFEVKVEKDFFLHLKLDFVKFDYKNKKEKEDSFELPKLNEIYTDKKLKSMNLKDPDEYIGSLSDSRGIINISMLYPLFKKIWKEKNYDENFKNEYLSYVYMCVLSVFSRRLKKQDPLMNEEDYTEYVSGGTNAWLLQYKK